MLAALPIPVPILRRLPSISVNWSARRYWLRQTLKDALVQPVAIILALTARAG
jgi:hypothetical protein